MPEKLSASAIAEANSANVPKKQGKRRNLQGWEGTLITVLAVGLAIFQLYTAFFGVLPTMQQRSFHVAFVLPMIFLLYPATKKSPRDHATVIDWIFAILAAIGALYVFFGYEDIATRSGEVYSYELYMGAVFTALVFIAGRRVLGWPLPIFCFLFLLFAYFGRSMPGPLQHFGLSVPRIIEELYLTTDGLFGLVTGVSATYIYLFVLFGAFLTSTRTSEFFNDFSMALTGHLKGGPAKISVLSSALMGTISGSTSANVATTGAFTIPLMKSIGYKPYFAGAVEAASSTGGQIMPPIMGAGAFILAEMIGVPYGKVAIAAILPAVLYFLAVAFQVDFEAGRLGLHGLPADKLPPRMKTFKEGWLFLIPILVLIWALCIVSYSANYSALYASAVILVIGFTFKMRGERLTIKKVFEAIARGARDMLSIAMACSVAGLMIGVLTKTGLGLKFTALLLSISGGAKLTTLILTMIGCTILGMGLPTTAAFIITATLCAPALIQLQITPLAAYMFVFYYACLSAITPPVALAAFAAAGLSGAKPLDTGVSATRLGLAGFLIPFFFCFTPAMLFQGSVSEIIRVSITSLIGIYLLSGGLEGFMYVKLNFLERVLLVAAALLMVDQGWLTDVLGLGIGVAIILLQVRELRKNKIANKL